MATVAKCIEQWTHTHWYISHSCWSVRHNHFVFACKNVILSETLALLQDLGEDNYMSSINLPQRMTPIKHNITYVFMILNFILKQ